MNLRTYYEPRPTSGYVVVVTFNSSREVVSTPHKTTASAHRHAMPACLLAANGHVLGVESVTIYRAPGETR